MTEPRESSAVSPAIFREGWDSYHAQGRRRAIGANPYEFGSPEWVAWREGYTDAEGERIKELSARGLDRSASLPSRSDRESALLSRP